MLNVPGPRNAIVALIDEMTRAHGRLKSLFASINIATGLSVMEATVLSAVIEASLPPTVPKIGRSLGHPRQVIQRAANALIAAGLIESAPNPRHKRAPLLLATREGRDLNHEAGVRAAELSGALLRRVDTDRCRRVAGDLRELRIEIEDFLRSGKAKP